MEVVFAIAIGILAGSGVWLSLRPRTFQVLMGLTLLSYAVNLFIFGMGRLQVGRAPIIAGERAADAAPDRELENHAGCRLRRRLRRHLVRHETVLVVLRRCIRHFGDDAG